MMAESLLGGGIFRDMSLAVCVCVWTAEESDVEWQIYGT